MSLPQPEVARPTVSPRERALRINERLAGRQLFGAPKGERHASQNSTWRITPEPVHIDSGTWGEIEALGPHLLAFYHAANRLYAKSARGKAPGWVREYLEAGKGETVIDYGRMNRFRTDLPVLIRPDLIPTPSGLVATELDSVPGGIGLLAALADIYTDEGFALVGGARGMVAGFGEAVVAAWRRSKAASQADDREPLVAIIISDESDDYRGEMIELAALLVDSGRRAIAAHPREIEFEESGLFVTGDSGRERIDIVYRFFELFDLKNIPKIDLILYAIRKELVAVTPPLKAHLEEKLWFALLHHPALVPHWKSELPGETYRLLLGLFPRTWVLDPRPVPPHAVIPGLTTGSRAVHSWDDLKVASQKERELVIKPSGFSPDAWGSRGVAVGHDMAAEEWVAALDRALSSFPTTPHILQEFHTGERAQVSYYDFESDEVRNMAGRARLCPYYFVTGEEDVRLGGILATVSPPDKKVIHGMIDAVMAPVAVGGGGRR